MQRVYIGIDAHKESNVLALAFAENGVPELYGKAPADLKGVKKGSGRLNRHLVFKIPQLPIVGSFYRSNITPPLEYPKNDHYLLHP